jgi:hypothetical protein
MWTVVELERLRWPFGDLAFVGIGQKQKWQMSKSSSVSSHWSVAVCSSEMHDNDPAVRAQMLRPAIAIGFFCSEVLALIVFLALAMLLSAGVSTDGSPYTSSLWSTHEIARSVGASIGFLVLSGYIVSVTILSVIFRSRLLSLTHGVWLTLLFILHAGFFLFYLRGPAVLSSGLILLATGVVCVLGAAAVEYFLWRKWLAPRGRLI